MARFRPSGQPAQPVEPTKSPRQTSRLHGKDWGSDCEEHGGQKHHCVRAWRHGGDCECGCGEEDT